MVLWIFMTIFAPVMKKTTFISGVIALMCLPTLFSACDDAEKGIEYRATAFPVGEAHWRSDVSSEEQAIITNLINNMVKVEACQFYMGAQAKSVRRPNYYNGYISTSHQDTIWFNASDVTAYWRDLKSKDTVWYNPKDFHFIDSLKTKHDTIPYAQVYRNGSCWVGPVTEISMPDYFIGKYEITQSEWMTVMHKAPTGHYCIIESKGDSAWYSEIGLGDRVAAYNVWYQDARDFCDSLSAKTGLEFRLPTEAEWECAARGGKYTRGYRFPGSDSYLDAGWVGYNSAEMKRGSEGYGIHEGGEKLANELGICDMCGNVSEWVANAYYRYGATDSINPGGKTPLCDGQDTLVLRGGSWMQKTSLDFNCAHRKLCIISHYTTEESLQSAFVNCGFRICISGN